MLQSKSATPADDSTHMKVEYQHCQSFCTPPSTLSPIHSLHSLCRMGSCSHLLLTPFLYCLCRMGSCSQFPARPQICLAEKPQLCWEQAGSASCPLAVGQCRGPAQGCSQHTPCPGPGAAGTRMEQSTQSTALPAAFLRVLLIITLRFSLRWQSDERSLQPLEGSIRSIPEAPCHFQGIC